MNIEKLTAKERRQLTTLLRQTHDARWYRRVLAVLEASSGKSVVEIADMLRVSRQSVYNWIEDFRHTRDVRTLADSPRSGRPCCWNEEAESVLQALLKDSPQHLGYFATQWTVPLLQEQLWHGIGEHYSGLTIRRSLHRLGYVWKRARYVLTPDPEREKKRQIRRTLSGVQERSVLLAEDETDLLLFPPLRGTWSVRGKPAPVLLSGQNARRVVFGAMNLATGHRLFEVRLRQYAEDFQAFLHSIRAHYRGWHVTLLLDGDSSHTAKESQKLTHRLGIRLLWLPIRAPELNPIDTLWGQAKDVVSANKQYAAIDEQVDLFISYLYSLSNKDALQTSGVLSENFWLKDVLSKNFCIPA